MKKCNKDWLYKVVGHTFKFNVSFKKRHILNGSDSKFKGAIPPINKNEVIEVKFGRIQKK